MIRILVICGALILLGCSGCGTSGSLNFASGIQGIATITFVNGPPDPSGTGHLPTDVPYKGTTIALLHDGIEVARVRTGEDGSFKFTVPPADYRLMPIHLPGDWNSQGPSKFVTVLPNQVLSVTLSYTLSPE